MTNKDKELLLEDLSGRYPHGVWISCPSLKREFVLDRMDRDKMENSWYLNGICEIDDCKPYLRPMESMTEEEKVEIRDLYHQNTQEVFKDPPEIRVYRFYDISVVDWLNKKMFDYRGLIEKGLALKATDEIEKQYGIKKF